MVRSRPFNAGGAASASSHASSRQKRLDKQALIHNASQYVLKPAKKPKSSRTKPPPGYTFLSVGYPDLAEKCRELSADKGVDFRQISASNKAESTRISGHLHRIGYHIRTDIFDEACQMIGYRIENGKLTKDTYAQSIQGFETAFGRYGIDIAQEIKQKASEEDARKVKATIRELFPHIPEDEAKQIFSRAWQKGSQNIGHAEDVPIARKVQLAVAAHIRHQHTDYDRLLNSRLPWMDARRSVEQACLRKLIEWRGDDPEGLLSEAFQGVLEDTIVISDDEMPAERSEPDRYADNEDSSDDSIVIENNPITIAAELERPPSTYESGTDVYAPRRRMKKPADEGKRRSAFLAKYQQARSQRQQHQHSNRHPANVNFHTERQSAPSPHPAQPQALFHNSDYSSHPQPCHVPPPSHGQYSPAYPPPPQPPPVYQHQPYTHETVAIHPPPTPTVYAQQYVYPQVHAHAPSAVTHPQLHTSTMPVQDLPLQRFYDDAKREVLIDPATHELMPIVDEMKKPAQAEAVSTATMDPRRLLPAAVPTSIGQPPIPANTGRPVAYGSVNMNNGQSYQVSDDDDDAYEPPSSAARPDIQGRTGHNKRLKTATVPESYSSSSQMTGQTSTGPYRETTANTQASRPTTKLNRRQRQKKSQAAKQQSRARSPPLELSYDDGNDDDDDDDDEYDPSQPAQAVQHSAPAVISRPAPQFYAPPPQLTPGVPVYDRRRVVVPPPPQHGAPALIQPSQKMRHHHHIPPPPPPPPHPSSIPQYAPAPMLYQHPVHHYHVAPPPVQGFPQPHAQYYQRPPQGYDPYYSR